MDDLDISGRLGGAISLSSGYARNPLVIKGPDGKQKLAVVSQEAFVDIGGAVTHDRFRGYINLPMPLVLSGTSGTLGPYQFTAPSVSLGTSPDTISDLRIGFDVRLLGEPGSLDFKVSIVDAPSEGAYPISSFTWIVVPVRIADDAKRSALTGFLRWMLGPGQRQAAALGYLPLPKDVVTREEAAIARIQ